MKQQIEGKHENDENGNPAGGTTTGVGIDIRWQKGPLGRGEGRQEPNGAFVEGVIDAARNRLDYYQQSQFNSVYNERAIVHLDLALAACEQRTADREAQGIEGTHQKGGPSDNVDDDILNYFSYAHLPEKLQSVSKLFWAMSRDIAATITCGPERSVALRKLLEAKDAAVRAAL